jgi:hypothetical protein
MRFAGGSNPREREALMAAIDAGQQMKAKQRDSGPGAVAYSAGQANQVAKDGELSAGGARGEFHEATLDKANKPYFDGFWNRLRSFRDFEDGVI